MSQDFERLSRALKEEGGFSVSPSGRAPKSGKMVAVEEAETRIPGVATPDRLEAFYANVEPTMASTRHGYFGGWVSGGDTYLDVSQRFPDNEQARDAIVQRDQLAGYDVDAGADIETGQQRLFKHEVDPSYPARRDIVDFMGGELHGALGLGERARRTERSRWKQEELG